MRKKFALFLSLMVVSSGVASWQNATVMLTGDYSEVYADGKEVAQGTYAGLDYPYIVMQNGTAAEGILATSGFLEASYQDNTVSLTKKKSEGRFLLPANTGTYQDIEDRKNVFGADDFLKVSEPSFTGQLLNEHTVSVIADYDNISLSGDIVIDVGPNSEIRVESTSSSSFKDVLSGGQSNVSITGE